MITLFEIPIYQMNKEQYDRSWEKKITRMYHKTSLIADSDEWDEDAKAKDERNHRRSFEKSKLNWHYSTIIGFLLIMYDPIIREIVFDYVIEEGIRRFDSARRKNMIKQNMLGEHFKVDENWSNEEILKEIRNEIYVLQKTVLKNRYLDTSVFNNLAEAVDFRKLCDKE